MTTSTAFDTHGFYAMLCGPALPVGEVLRMKAPSYLIALVAAVLPAAPAAAFAAPPAAPPAAAWHRVELKPAGQGKPLPYTIEVPQDWQVRQVEGYPGLWIGPADAHPPDDPRLIWVRGSQVPLAKPDEVVANIKANDAKDAEWSSPRAEVKEVGGVRGVLWQMDSGAGDAARSTLTLKVPLANLAADFVASAKASEFPKMLPTYERILLSVRPIAPSAPAGKKP